MKKQLLIILFWVGFLNAQTYQNPTFGTVTTKTNTTDNLALKVNVQSTNGAINTQAITSPIQTQFDALNTTRVISGAGVTINVDPTKFDIQVVGEIVNPTTFSRTAINKNVTGIPATYLAAQTESYVWVDSNGTVIQSLTAPSPLIFDDILGYWVLVHSNLTSITLVNSFPMYSDGSAIQVHQILDFIGFSKYAGSNVISTGTTGTRLTHTGGNAIKNGGGNTSKRPVFSLSGAVDATFQMRTQTGASGVNTQSIDVNNIDIGGTITTLSNNKFAACKVWKFSSSLIRVQYGQKEYDNIGAAISGADNDTYIDDGNSHRNGIPIGWVIFKKGTSWGAGGAGVVNVDYAFKDIFGGKITQNLVSTLQTSYNISPLPQITTSASLGAVTVKRGSTSDTDNILVGQNGAGSNTFSINGNGNAKIGNPTSSVIGHPSDSFNANNSVKGGLRVENTQGEALIVNTTAYAGGSHLYDANVLAIQNKSTYLGVLSDVPSAIRFMSNTDGEMGAIGYQNGAIGSAFANSMFLAASMPYCPSCPTVAPTRLALIQEGDYLGSLTKIERLEFNSDWGVRLKTPNGTTRVEMPVSGNILIHGASDNGSNFRVNGTAWFDSTTYSGDDVFTGSNKGIWFKGASNYTGGGVSGRNSGTDIGIFAGGNEAVRIVGSSGNTLFGTITDNGVDKGQFNGTVSGSPATLSNQFVTKSQLDTAVATSGTYIPTFTSVSNSGSFTVQNATYTKVGNIITVNIGFNVSAPSIGQSIFSITLPFARSVSSTRNMGSGTANAGGTYLAMFGQSTSTTLVDTCAFNATSATSYVCSMTFQYSL